MLKLIIPMLAGFVLDMIFGDPYWLPHPIRFIGMLISVIEKMLRKLFPKTAKGEFIAGVFLVIVVLLISTGIPFGLLFVSYKVNLWLGIVVESIMCYQLLATKCLKKESMKVYDALKKGDTEGARTAVSMIVGRDTAVLDETGITKAAVETVAENTSDGSIAPLIFIVLGGAALGFFYKAVNTMDSMVGYKNEKYLYFGRTAAKLDDFLNFIPSRISAMIMILSAYCLRYNSKGAWKIWRRDRLKHASPNSAQTEAVCAGALNIQLAGDASYFGKLYKKQTIGDSICAISPEHIKEANRLLYSTAILTLGIVSTLKILILWSFI